MGWFSRDSSDQQGFYTGDAPVSMPGANGAAPTAYTDRYAPSAPAPAWNVAAADSAASPAAPAPTFPPGPTFQPPSTVQPEPVFPPPGPLFDRAAPPNMLPSQALAQPPALTAEQSRAIQTALTLARRSRQVRGGCLPIVLLIIIASIGIPLYFVFKDVVGPVRDNSPAATLTGTVGAPVSVKYRGATVAITVKSVVAQPVDGWSSSDRTAGRHLVAEVLITRTDGGSSSVTMEPWDWYFRPTEGAEIDAGLISDYSPQLQDVTLRPTDRQSAYLDFVSGSRSGTISLEDPSTGRRTAQWTVSGTAPAVVAGGLGRPVRPLIGSPSFTVALSEPRWLAATDPTIYDRPAKPPILLITATFTGTGTANHYSGSVTAKNLWFVPTSGPAVGAGAGLVRGERSSVSLTGTARGSLVVAVQVARSAGAIELRNNAGVTIARWPIAG